MKTLKKINLRGLSEVLSEKELKNVMGGSDGGGGSHIYICYQCMNNETGSCSKGDAQCWDNISEICPSGWMEWDCYKE